MRPRTDTLRLIFFVWQTVLLATSALFLAGRVLGRSLDAPIHGYVVLAFTISLVALPLCCAACISSQPRLARFGMFTLSGLLLLDFLSSLFP